MLKYKEKKLKKLSKEMLIQRLNMVKTSPDLTEEEKTYNIDLIETVLNGGSKCKRQKEIMDGITEGAADISDMGGY